MTRNGKIARLPAVVREELNQRLRDGETGKELVDWLNALPEVQGVVARRFKGKRIREQNLSEWRNGGYREWLVQREVVAAARGMESDAGSLSAAAGGELTENLATAVTARYAVAMARWGWDGAVTPEFRGRLRELRGLCRDIGGIRRGDYLRGKLELEREKDEWERRLKLQTSITKLQRSTKTQAPICRDGKPESSLGERRDIENKTGPVEAVGKNIRPDPAKSGQNIFFEGGDLRTGENLVTEETVEGGLEQGGIRFLTSAATGKA